MSDANLKLTDAVTEWLLKIEGNISSGTKSLGFFSEVVIPPMESVSYDLAGLIDETEDFDLLSAEVYVVKKDEVGNSNTYGLWIDPGATLTYGINKAGMVKVYNPNTSAVTVNINLRAPTSPDLDGVTVWGNEVPVEDFIDGIALANAVGLDAGEAVNDDAPWLKYEMDGRTLYLAKNSYRINVKWNELNALGLIFGTTTVEVNGETYIVRVPKGLNVDSTRSKESGYDNEYTHGSEWNRLMYHVSGRPFVEYGNTLQSEGIYEGDYAQISEADLVMHHSFGNGCLVWCQEKTGGSIAMRGYNGVSYLGHQGAESLHPWFGWRPILELVD